MCVTSVCRKDVSVCYLGLYKGCKCVLPRSVDRVLCVLPRSINRLLVSVSTSDCSEGVVCVTSVCRQDVVCVTSVCRQVVVCVTSVCRQGAVCVNGVYCLQHCQVLVHGWVLVTSQHHIKCQNMQVTPPLFDPNSRRDHDSVT